LRVSKTALLLLWLLPLLVFSVPSAHAMDYYSDLRASSIEVISVAKNSVSINIHFVAELATGNPDLRPSMFYYFEGQEGAYVIGNYDPGWRLLETNNKTIWRWALSKTHIVSWTADQSFSDLSFPFERPGLVLFLVSNSTPVNFSPLSTVANFDVQVTTTSIGYDSLPFKTDAFQSFEHYYRIEITAYHNTEYIVLVLFLDIGLISVAGVACVLWRRREVTSTQDSNQIWLGLLLFSPIFFLTFRSSLAPPWITNLDIAITVFIVVLAILLGLQLNRQRAQPAPVSRLVESTDALTVLVPCLITLGLIVGAMIVAARVAKKPSH